MCVDSKSKKAAGTKAAGKKAAGTKAAGKILRIGKSGTFGGGRGGIAVKSQGLYRCWDIHSIACWNNPSLGDFIGFDCVCHII